MVHVRREYMASAEFCAHRYHISDPVASHGSHKGHLSTVHEQLRCAGDYVNIEGTGSTDTLTLSVSEG